MWDQLIEAIAIDRIMFPLDKKTHTKHTSEDTQNNREQKSMSHTKTEWKTCGVRVCGRGSERQREKSRIHLIWSWTTREFKFTTFHFDSTYFIFHTAEMGFVGRASKTAAIDRASVQKMQFFHWNGCYSIMHCINSIFHVWMWHRNQWKYSISTGNSAF